VSTAPVLTIQKTETIHRFLVEKTVKYQDGSGSWTSRVDRIYDAEDPRLAQGGPEAWKGRCSYLEHDETGKLTTSLQLTPHAAAKYLRRALKTGTWKEKKTVSDEEYVNDTIKQLAERLAKTGSKSSDKVSQALSGLLTALKDNEG